MPDQRTPDRLLTAIVDEAVLLLDNTGDPKQALDFMVKNNVPISIAMRVVKERNHRLLEWNFIPK
jgi:hypothetical protein